MLGGKVFFNIGTFGRCLITDLQPRSFWNKLGFSETHIDNSMKFDDEVFQSLASAGDKANYFDDRRVKTIIITANYRSPLCPGNMSRPYGLGNLDGDETLTYTLQSTLTRDLSADTPYFVDETGYYRIEVESVFDTEFKQEGQRLGAVVGCVSQKL